MLKLIMFDLDGTLLPLDETKFMQLYFSGLKAMFQSRGLSADMLEESIWVGTKAMVQNDGSMTNEDRFWKTFEGHGYGYRKDYDDVFLDFYRNQFEIVRQSTSLNPAFSQMVKELKQKGYRVVLATNPVFPEVATRQRVAWAGLEWSDFEIVTTFENSCYAKPGLDYYNSLIDSLGVKPEECLMVGNDAEEDMIAGKLGCRTFLLVDCLKNPRNLNIDQFEHGDAQVLVDQLASLPSLV
ncbi:MAG: HAD family hydrolase [Bacilli bacterium]|nr:HAD family hydrolase [Bacilli bacterium]